MSEGEGEDQSELRFMFVVFSPRHQTRHKTSNYKEKTIRLNKKKRKRNVQEEKCRRCFSIVAVRLVMIVVIIDLVLLVISKSILELVVSWIHCRQRLIRLKAMRRRRRSSRRERNNGFLPDAERVESVDSFAFASKVERRRCLLRDEKEAPAARGREEKQRSEKNTYRNE